MKERRIRLRKMCEVEGLDWSCQKAQRMVCSSSGNGGMVNKGKWEMDKGGADMRKKSRGMVYRLCLGKGSVNERISK